MKFLDLFSGIGGFRLGMEMAGHECVGHVEIDKYANMSYKAMHIPKEGEFFATDIRGVRPEQLPDADVYCGGFPCQAFSVAGKRGGFEDTRGTLFFEILRLAKERQPRLLFLENVAGLLNHDGGKTFGVILSALADVGYSAEWQVLNSKNFGVPQNRERVFIIGHLGNGRGREVFPITGTNGEVDEVGIENNVTVLSDSGQGRKWREQDFVSALRVGGDTQCVQIVGKDGKPKRNDDYASCLTGGGHSGGNHSDMDLIVQPVLTPDRPEKRQNGRRFKEDGEEMFTLTSQDRHWVAILTPKRTEYGKSIRKDYESGNVSESRHNMTKLEPRDDGCSGTLTSVQKDNLVLEYRHGVMIKLANENGNHYGGGLFDKDGISPTLQSSGGGGGTNNIPKVVDNQDRHGVMIKEATKQGYAIATEGDSINFSVPNSKTRRGRVGKGVAQTLDTQCNQGVLNNCRIRRLTPRECFRLQGFPDEYFDRAASVCSNSQLYKQAGNSVTVNVIYEIAKRLEV